MQVGEVVNSAVDKASPAVTQVYNDAKTAISGVYNDGKSAIIGAKDFARSNIDGVFGVVKGAEDTLGNIAWPLAIGAGILGGVLLFKK